MASLLVQHHGLFRRKELISLEPFSIEYGISPGVELGLKTKSNIFQQRILAGTHDKTARTTLSAWPEEVIGLELFRVSLAETFPFRNMHTEPSRNHLRSSTVGQVSNCARYQRMVAPVNYFDAGAEYLSKMS